jgi:hypothetical protein
MDTITIVETIAGEEASCVGLDYQFNAGIVKASNTNTHALFVTNRLRSTEEFH